MDAALTVGDVIYIHGDRNAGATLVLQPLGEVYHLVFRAEFAGRCQTRGLKTRRPRRPFSSNSGGGSFVKKQQMAWTLRGAHLLLQTRTKVLNNELENVF